MDGPVTLRPVAEDDLREQWFQALANRPRGLIVAQVGGAHARRPQQLFLGLAAQGAGDRQQLLDPLPARMRHAS